MENLIDFSDPILRVRIEYQVNFFPRNRKPI